MDTAPKTRTVLNHYLTIAGIVLAFWPVWLWYIARTLDSSDEPWGVLALTTAIALLIYSNRKSHPSTAIAGNSIHPLSQIGLILVLTLYITTYRIAPSLLQSILLVTSIWLAMCSKMSLPSRAGIFGLLLLSLPLIPSLNFYAGFPIRSVVAAGTYLLLNCMGLHTVQEGTFLSVNNKLVAIDAPCSGINMLWVAGYTAMLMAAFFKLRVRETAILSCLVLAIVPIGNIFRACALIIFDQVRLYAPSLSANLNNLEPITHSAIGLLTFIFITGVTLLITQKLSQIKPHSQAAPIPVRSKQTRSVLLSQWCIVALCLVAASVPLIATPIQATIPDDNPEWPKIINGTTLLSVDSLGEEKAFAEGFPGKMKRFTDGTNAYFIRFIRRESRQLHPSSDCFRGMGYSTVPRDVVVGVDGEQYSSFEASKANSRYLILERIYDSYGQSWTDVSAWYWAACLGETKGPWFDVTIAKPQFLGQSLQR